MPKYKVWISHTVDYICEIEAGCEKDVIDNWPSLTDAQKTEWSMDYETVEANYEVGVSYLEMIEANNET